MFGEDSVSVADALDGVSNCYQARDDLAHALEARTRSLAVREKALGPDSPDVALSLQGLAYIALDQGKCDEAIRASQRALAIFDKAGSPDKLRSTRSMRSVAARCAAASSPRRARRSRRVSRSPMRRVVVDRPARDRTHRSRRAALEAERYARARKLVREAVEIYRGVGRTDDLPELQSWLAKHSR